MKKLVLITVSYPYSKETFLNYELQELYNKFDIIDIVSLANRKNILHNSSMIYEEYLPKNVVFRKDLSSKINLITIPNIKLTILIKEIFKCGSLRCYIKILYRLLIGSKLYSVLLKEYKNDFNHITFYSYWLNSGALSLCFLKNYDTNILTIARAHGSDIFHEASNGKRNPFQSYMLQQIDNIYSISECGKKYLLKRHNIDSNKIRVSRLGVSIPLTMNPWKKRSILTIVSCSSIDENKRIELIISSLANVYDIDIDWVHFGSGKLLNNIVKIAHERLDNLSNINWEIKGFTPNTAIHHFYKTETIDLFINLSKSEGIPVSIMEAMSYGIPTIATNVGGTGEIVNNTNGYLISGTSSSYKICNIIKEYHETKEDKIKELRMCARNFIKSTYCAKNNFLTFSLEINNIRG